ncbi:TSUP family transporter [Christensenellaceae bacterium OttesenSCG-928-L17]|nr:TSUP family transporter [Christensenellaceae bacterium OttesenSCG-928-L17]
MELTAAHYLIVCPLVFLAGFADSIAGGGGVISLPAYIFTGMPTILAYGTNKFAMSLGTAVSATKYYRSGHVQAKTVLFAVMGALIGSALGAQIAMLLDEIYLRYCMMVLLPVVAVFLTVNRRFGEHEQEKNLSRAKEYTLSALIGLLVGAYDGFFGPGAGMFYTLLFVSLLGCGLITAAGNARVVNLASNIGALVVYVLRGNVVYALGIPAAICAVLGNYIGARLAIQNGARFIRPVMAVVIVLLVIKMVVDIVG